MTPVAQMLGSHRIVTGNGIVHPLGAADATPEAELQLRRRILERAAAATLFVRLAEASGAARFRDAAQWALLSYAGSAEVYGAYAASFGHALDLYLSS